MARMRRFRRMLLLLALLLAAARPALADEALARRKFREGQEHFAAQRYREAATAYEAAYAARKLPAFLFNLAQCYRNLGELARAVTFYRSYLAGSPQAANRRAVLTTIAELEARLREEKHAVPDMPIPVVPPPPATAPSPPAAAPAPSPSAAPPASVTPPPSPVLPSAAASPELRSGPVAGVDAAPAASKPIYRRWWFWTIIGVAVAGGATAAGVLATRGGGSITQSSLGEFHVLPPSR